MVLRGLLILHFPLTDYNHMRIRSRSQGSEFDLIVATLDWKPGSDLWLKWASYSFSDCPPAPKLITSYAYHLICFLSPWYRLGTHFILKTSLWGRYYCDAHFLGENIDRCADRLSRVPKVVQLLWAESALIQCYHYPGPKAGKAAGEKGLLPLPSWSRGAEQRGECVRVWMRPVQVPWRPFSNINN